MLWSILNSLTQLSFGVQTTSAASCNGFCPGSAMYSITAAFGTEGLYMQAEILHYLLDTEHTMWAPLLYVLSAFAGMISLVLGMPPKNYLWFFLGPAFYSWLLGTPSYVKGVEWKIASVTQDQSEVWKLSELGLLNQDYVQRNQIVVGNSMPPSKPARVSWFFAWFDELISNTVQWMVRWTGIQNRRTNSNSAHTSTNEAPTGPGGKASVGSGGAIHAPYGGAWNLIYNIKWQIMEDISGAHLTSSDMRDVLAKFLASECGDELLYSLDINKYVHAQTNSGRLLPDTVFQDPEHNGQYATVIQNLRSRNIPIPKTLRRYWNSCDTQGFYYFYAGNDKRQKAIDNLLEDEMMIRCDQMLEIVIDAFRFESAHIFYQLAYGTRPNGTPRLLDDSNAQDVVYDLFYGWGIKRCDRSSFSGVCTAPDSGGTKLSMQEQTEFMQNLILVQMIRNEFLRSKQIYYLKKTPAMKVEEYIKANQKEIGGKAKFGELYNWSVMVPYLQGALLYFLTMLYPLACVLIVVPGWHKTLMHWAMFFVWVKMWDVGFAIVGVLERSMWSMLGNTSDAKTIAQRIVDLGHFARVSVVKGTVLTGAAAGNASVLNVPTITDSNPMSVGGALVGGTGSGHTAALLKILDTAMITSSSMDLGAATNFYVFIIAGLLLAVPVITGQLVLGSKAGMTSVFTNIIGQVAQEGGKAVGSGHTGDVAARAKANSASIGQASYMKALRSNGAIDQALQWGQDASLAGLRAGLNDKYAASLGAGRDALAQNKATQDAASKVIWGQGGVVPAVINSKGGQALVGAASNMIANGAGAAGRGMSNGLNNMWGGDGSSGNGKKDKDGQPGGTNGVPPMGTSVATDPRTTAGTPGGDPKGAANGVLNTGGPIAGLWTQYGADMIKDAVKASPGIIDAASIYHNQRQFQINSAMSQALGLEATISGWGENTAHNALASASGKQANFADFDASEEMWADMAAYSFYYGGLLSSEGGLGGTLDAGAQPKGAEVGAWAGQAGAHNYNSAHFLDPHIGSYFHEHLPNAMNYAHNHWGANWFLGEVYGAGLVDGAVRPIQATASAVKNHDAVHNTPNSHRIQEATHHGTIQYGGDAKEVNVFDQPNRFFDTTTGPGPAPADSTLNRNTPNITRSKE